MKRFCALAIALAPLAALADNYLGVLKTPPAALDPLGMYSLASGPSFGTAPGFTAFAPAPSAFTTIAPESGYRFKLGYKYSRYFSVEGEVSDFARPVDVFANPASLTSPFRSTGVGIDTVATLPIWRFSFYGRMGAYRGERNGFSPYSTALLGDQVNRGMRWRYGLGVRYDITKAIGIRAELERYSASGLGAPLAGDGESDQFTLGVSWRF